MVKTKLAHPHVQLISFLWGILDETDKHFFWVTALWNSFLLVTRLSSTVFPTRLFENQILVDVLWEIECIIWLTYWCSWFYNFVFALPSMFYFKTLLLIISWLDSGSGPLFWNIKFFHFQNYYTSIWQNKKCMCVCVCV